MGTRTEYLKDLLGKVLSCFSNLPNPLPRHFSGVGCVAPGIRSAALVFGIAETLDVELWSTAWLISFSAWLISLSTPQNGGAVGISTSRECPVCNLPGIWKTNGSQTDQDEVKMQFPDGTGAEGHRKSEAAHPNFLGSHLHESATFRFFVCKDRERERSCHMDYTLPSPKWWT